MIWCWSRGHKSPRITATFFNRLPSFRYFVHFFAPQSKLTSWLIYGTQLILIIKIKIISFNSKRFMKWIKKNRLIISQCFAPRNFRNFCLLLYGSLSSIDEMNYISLSFSYPGKVFSQRFSHALMLENLSIGRRHWKHISVLFEFLVIMQFDYFSEKRWNFYRFFVDSKKIFSSFILFFLSLR